MHWLLVAVLAIPTWPGVSEAIPDPVEQAGGPRIRPQDARVARYLQEGLNRSAALRALARRIEAGTVIAYVETEPRLSPHLGGGLTWLAASGGYRYVRVSISPRLQARDAIATLAHELQHVAEVMDAPHVVCPLSLLTHFRTIGLARSREGHAWDTIAALDMGATVRRDITRPAIAATVTSLGSALADWTTWYRRELRREDRDVPPSESNDDGVPS